ncbi:hypothetical protein Nepgr_020406 [Nepenthes gracilis]|uniref:Uncharacterized protein n=1 Tax=Nepenthes gracilis TaxID=150966 RepID=A0AAD3SWT4_NEPGR|nr:hypothetical protein Nepgr_020406 [Nepenthes gracilis]
MVARSFLRCCLEQLFGLLLVVARSGCLVVFAPPVWCWGWLCGSSDPIAGFDEVAVRLERACRCSIKPLAVGELTLYGLAAYANGDPSPHKSWMTNSLMNKLNCSLPSLVFVLIGRFSVSFKEICLLDFDAPVRMNSSALGPGCGWFVYFTVLVDFWNLGHRPPSIDGWYLPG